MSKPKIVILGAGYGGLRTLRGIQKKHLNAEIILVNKNDYHYEATYLHEVASGAKLPEQISYQVKDVVDSNQTTFIQDTVLKVNKDEKTVSLEKNGEISFDYLVFALGFESESFGIPGVDEFGLPMVTIDSAVEIREHMYRQFELYKETQDDSLLSIVVCGAGFTSIEYLGELTQQLPKAVKKYNLPEEKIKLTCIEAMPTLLPMFTDKLANYGIQKLKDRGVNFIIGTPIKEITADTVIYEENGELKSVKAKTIVWTTGVKGSHVVGESGFDERRGRVMVEADLTAPGYPDIFIIGDCSAVMDPESNRPYPTTAQIALKQADGVVTNLVAKLANKPTTAFSFKSQGSVCSIGNNEAIGEVMGTNLKGYPASVMKKIIEDKSLSQTGGLKIMFSKGRFDLYH